MKKMLTIGEAATAIGVTTTTLRNWDKKGLLKPDDLTKGGDRRYKLESLKNIKPNLNLNKDVLEIITVFSARLYGSRSNKNKKLLEDVNKAVNENMTTKD